MEKVLIAIALDKNGNLAKTHFGDADFIQYIQMENGEITFSEKKENILKNFNEEKHGGHGKMKFAAEVLQDVKIVISGAMSPNFKRLKTNANLYPIVSKKDLENTIQYLKDNLQKIMKFFSGKENLVYFIE
ncbi:NifB/NifX family molybdenum-iron cluster-binding protein [Deferribacter autotrophicus]|nr:NifB/NifX family molybdenum-iron cluster-binding protein [Deferribacter autotrophicus]